MGAVRDCMDLGYHMLRKCSRVGRVHAYTFRSADAYVHAVGRRKKKKKKKKKGKKKGKGK